MNTTLLFFLLLIPLSGFIAWAGDKIGHRIGKRRQSLFGLRPRHTATLITIGAGIGITLTSFAGMWAISKSFRNVLARGAALARDNQTLQNSNERLTERITEAGRRVRELREDAQKAQAARDAALTQTAKAEGNLATARQQLVEAERTLAGERKRLAGAQSALESAHEQIGAAQAAVRDARARRERAETDLNRAQERVRLARKEVNRANEKVATAERVFEQVMRSQSERLAEQREQLRTQSADLESQSQQLIRQRTQLAEQQGRITSQDGTIQSQTARLEMQRGDMARLTAEVADLETKRLASQAALLQIAESSEALRNKRVTYRVGEEVARLSLSPGISIWKVQNALEGLMTAAAKKAESRGARTGSQTLRAVWIPTRALRGRDGTVEKATEVDALHAASMSIRGANEEVVVVVLATSNAVQGEPVPVDLRTYKNPLLFTAGETLGELTVTGRSTRQEVADALYNFLRRDMRFKLLKAGVIPASLGSGLEAEPIGEASIDALLQVMEDVRGNSKSRVIVRAARDLRAADPVTLQFEVKPLEMPPVAGDTRPDLP